MIVVSDTTAISNLIRIGEVDLLRILYGEIWIPKAVYEELLILKDLGINVLEVLKYDYFKIVEVNNDILIKELMIDLDKGEAEAIALAIEKKVEYLLIDELKGRKIASEKSIKIIGKLGILIKAKQEKLIESVKEKMDDLRSIGFWISQSLYDKIVELENEIK